MWKAERPLLAWVEQMFHQWLHQRFERGYVRGTDGCDVAPLVHERDDEQGFPQRRVDGKNDVDFGRIDLDRIEKSEQQLLDVGDERLLAA